MKNFISYFLLTLALTSAPEFASAQENSGIVVFAPAYGTLQPPNAGTAYVDPVFGSTIKRITNALATHDDDRGGNLNWIANEYSTASPFNSDNSRFLLVHQSYFGLYDANGTYLSDLPFEISASSEPRWSRTEAATLYYHTGNQLKSYNIFTGAAVLVHAFREYSVIDGAGEMDISLDGDHLVFAGDGREIFLYQISTDQKSAVFSLEGRHFDSIYVTPDNNVSVTWLQSGTSRYTGIELFDSNLQFVRQIAHAGGHMHYTRDTNGEEVLVWTNSNDPHPSGNCRNGIVKIRLVDATQTCLLQLDWSLAVHITAPDGNGTVLVDTEAPSNPDPDSTAWKPYTNEILQIKLDGSQVNRLAHHRSLAFNSYNWEPKLSVSRDGTKLLFVSDFNLQSLDGAPKEYGDTYYMDLPEIVTPAMQIRKIAAR